MAPFLTEHSGQVNEQACQFLMGVKMQSAPVEQRRGQGHLSEGILDLLSKSQDRGFTHKRTSQIIP